MSPPGGTARFVIDKISLDQIGSVIGSKFGGEFKMEADTTSKPQLPLLQHVPSGHRFLYIPGGRFEMGFSDSEERAAKTIFDPIPANIGEMRPLKSEQVLPFLMAERPILTREIAGHQSSHPDAAAYVSYEEAVAYSRGFGMTLASESQWEYACRAGTSTLFTFGDQLPNDEELAEWLTFDFSRGNGRANAFGLHGLFVGEWCLDLFTNSYELNADLSTDGSTRVVRGGGAYFWPWQDQEWVWCMSAMRCPSTDLPEAKCSFRLVRNLS